MVVTITVRHLPQRIVRQLDARPDPRLPLPLQRQARREPNLADVDNGGSKFGIGAEQFKVGRGYLINGQAREI